MRSKVDMYAQCSRKCVSVGIPGFFLFGFLVLYLGGTCIHVLQARRTITTPRGCGSFRDGWKTLQRCPPCEDEQTRRARKKWVNKNVPLGNVKSIVEKLRQTP